MNKRIDGEAKAWLERGNDTEEWVYITDKLERAAIVTLTALLLSSYLALVILSIATMVTRNYSPF